jgi:S1-C subfamily serine protease
VTLELHITSGARAGATERFDKALVTVGRHPSSDLRFDPDADADVSARHAELRLVDGTWRVRDDGSTNGTFVNGARITGEQRLSAGDTIRFGAHGPMVEVRSVARANTEVRVAAAVHRQTASLRRAMTVAGVLLLALVVSGGVFWQRRTEARERELMERLVRSDSAAASLQRAIASMQSRDSVFARELAARALPREDATMEQQRLQRAVTSVNFAAIHDRNDSAVAMVASDLDGSFIAGTAFGITRDGQLVTNRHVVHTAAGAPARRIRVIYANTTAWLPARIVRTSETDDLAVIQIEPPGRYPVVVGVSPNGLLARPGSPVMSIGYPHAVDTPMEGQGLRVTARTTTTAGTVSKLLDDVLQVDSYAGKGSSGSPVLDARGEVIGVVFGGAPESNGRIVYAVPWKRVRAFVSSVKD